MRNAANIQLTAKGKATGFTLIELLIVIAIISLLAAILFPVFGRARENARRSSCQSNLKQIGLGIVQYAQDFDEIMVPVETSNSPSNTWHTLIQPYVKSTQILTCPSNQSTMRLWNSSTTTVPFGHYVGNGSDDLAIGTNSAFNSKRPMDRTDPTTGAISTTPVAQIQTPAQCIMVFENTPSSSPNNKGFIGSPSAWNFQGHLKTTNFLFCDGHIKALKPTATFTAGSLNMWFADPKYNLSSSTIPGSLAGQDSAID